MFEVENNSAKKKSTLLRDAIALFLITLFSGLALSVVYEITKGPIKQRQDEKNFEAYSKVFTEAASISDAEDLVKLAKETELSVLDSAYSKVNVETVKLATDDKGNIIGYVIHLLTKEGFAPPMQVVIGYSTDHIVMGLDFPEFNETKEVDELKGSYRLSYVGKSADKFSFDGSNDTTQIDAVSGATISSKAIVNAVNAGISFLNEYVDELGGGAVE